MRVTDITLVGWFHAAVCLIALFAGALNLFSAKGTAQHRLVGNAYFWSMIALNLSALAIFRFDIARFKPFVAGPHIFGLFHWFAVVTLVFVLIGRYAASRQNRALWAYVHPLAMVLSYYMLVGGAINEAFTRINALRALSQQSLRHAAASHAAVIPLIGLTQTAAMAAALLLILYFSARVAFYRRTVRA